MNIVEKNLGIDPSAKITLKILRGWHSLQRYENLKTRCGMNQQFMIHGRQKFAKASISNCSFKTKQRIPPSIMIKSFIICSTMKCNFANLLGQIIDSNATLNLNLMLIRELGNSHSYCQGIKKYSRRKQQRDLLFQILVCYTKNFFKTHVRHSQLWQTILQQQLKVKLFRNLSYIGGTKISVVPFHF